MKKYLCFAVATLIAIALLPASALAQEQDPVQLLRAQIGVQAATSLFDISDAASNPRLMLDDMGKLTIYGMIESTTGGITFPDGTTQITAATGGGTSLWSQSGANIFYNAGKVGIGRDTPAAWLDVTAQSLLPVIMTRGLLDFSAPPGEAIVFGRLTSGSPPFTYDLFIAPNGDVGIGGASNNGVKLNVRGGFSQPTVFNVENSDGANLFQIAGGGAITAIGPLAVSNLIESQTGGFKFPDGTTQTTAATGGLWSASGANIFYNAGDVGVGTSSPAARLDVSAVGSEPSIVTRDGTDYATASGQKIDFGHWDGTTFTERLAISSAGDVGIGFINSNVKLNVRNTGNRNFAFNVEQDDGTNLFLIAGGGAITALGPLAVSNLIESQTGGFKFPDGTTQTTAATGGLWSASGANIFYNAGDVGVGAVNSNVKLNVRNDGSNGFAFNVEKADGANIFQVRNDGAVLFDNGNVGINQAYPNVQLNVQNDGSNGQVLRVEKADGTNLFTVGGNGDVLFDNGNVGINQVISNAQFNVQNDGSNLIAFRVEKADGTNLFTVQDNGVIFPGGTTISKEGDLTLTGGAAPTVVLDHPLDPAEKQLRFTAVEAPDRYTFHTGTVVLDAAGAATVALPDWYEASNTDLRYQLTPIGAPGPNLYIAQKVQNNRFEIAGGTVGMEVSWLLTATRSDAAARARPFEAEAQKTAEDRGRYYTPEAHGQPTSLRINSGEDVDDRAQPFDN